METGEKNGFAFNKINYIIMIAGLGIILLGFIIMGMETQEYGFGPLGLTVGPIVVFIGFISQFFAILYRQKSKE